MGVTPSTVQRWSAPSSDWCRSSTTDAQHATRSRIPCNVFVTFVRGNQRPTGGRELNVIIGILTKMTSEVSSGKLNASGTNATTQ